MSGTIGLLVFQVFQNIGMTIGLMPITGIALPFLSYGGSALITNMLLIGLVLNVAMRTKHYMFETDEEVEEPVQKRSFLKSRTKRMVARRSQSDSP